MRSDTLSFILYCYKIGINEKEKFEKED
jgi:hypothetical protein